TLPKNMFYTVTLPATLWFFDKGKSLNYDLNDVMNTMNDGKTKNHSADTILFIDARNIFRQVTRALREVTDEHIQNIATIVRLYRGENHRLQELLNKYQQQANGFEKQANEQKQEVEKIQKAKPTEDKELKRWEKQLEEAEKQWKTLTEKQNYFLGH